MGNMIGHARCSPDKPELAANRQIRLSLGVPADLIYVDYANPGTSPAPPDLEQAPTTVRPGDALLAPRLDRLIRPVPDARQLGDTLATLGLRLQLCSMTSDLVDASRHTVHRVLERASRAAA